MQVNQRHAALMLICISAVLVLVLVLVKINLDRQGTFLCEYVESDPDLTMADCPAHNDPNTWLLTIAFGIAFLALGIGTYMLTLPARKEHPEKKADISKLDEEERKVHQLLTEHKGSMYQSDLMKAMEYSKVRMTRLLDRMESKQVVERKRRGMTNLVVLK